LTLADAIAAHDEALSYGGRAGIVSVHLIESALARPYSGYFRTIWQKAAAVLHGFVSNHGFTDGNKRTALLLTELMISRSGYELLLEPDEQIDDVIVNLAAGEMNLGDLQLWLRDRIVRAEG
jgi:death-on-curing protein